MLASPLEAACEPEEPDASPVLPVTVLEVEVGSPVVVAPSEVETWTPVVWGAVEDSQAIPSSWYGRGASPRSASRARARSTPLEAARWAPDSSAAPPASHSAAAARPA